jgi:hypothetical protein
LEPLMARVARHVRELQHLSGRALILSRREPPCTRYRRPQGPIHLQRGNRQGDDHLVEAAELNGE